MSSVVINLGPCHPSTHGVARCVASNNQLLARSMAILNGEVIQYLSTEIGLSSSAWTCLPTVDTFDVAGSIIQTLEPCLLLINSSGGNFSSCFLILSLGIIMLVA